MKHAAVMLIVNDYGLILSVQRRHVNKFGLPGGKIDPGESTEAAAIRETFEETKITVHECIFLCSREEGAEIEGGESFITDCYVATAWDGIPQSPEGLEVLWLPASALLSNSIGAFPEYNKIAIEEYIKKCANKGMHKII